MKIDEPEQPSEKLDDARTRAESTTDQQVNDTHPADEVAQADQPLSDQNAEQQPSPDNSPDQDQRLRHQAFADGEYHHSQLHGSSESDMIRAARADQPPASPLDVTRAMIGRSVNELSQVLPKQMVYWKDDGISILSYEEITSKQKNLIGETVGTGKSSVIVSEDHVRVLIADGLANMETVLRQSGDYSVVIPQGSTPDDVTRLLSRALGDIYHERHPESREGVYTELDAVSMLWNRAEVFSFEARTAGREDEARVWAGEASELREEFRARAEAIDILPHDGNPPDLAQAKRHEAWPGMSDNTRRLASDLAGEPMPNFLPGADRFKESYNRLDDMVYFLKTHTSRDELEEFLKEVLRDEVTGADFPGQFKKIYKGKRDDDGNYDGFFPSISGEGPLSQDKWENALRDTTELCEKVEDAYARVVDWAGRHQVFSRNNVTIDEAVAIGEAVYRRAYEETVGKITGILTEVCKEYNERHKVEDEEYKIKLDYVGSMSTGSRGPHKGGVHANLDDFDLDLFVVYRDWYDMEYTRVMTFVPDGSSRGKLPSEDQSVAAPELNELNAILAAKLKDAFPMNPSVTESTVALRRESPPPRRPSAM